MLLYIAKIRLIGSDDYHMIKTQDISSIESEAGVIASLIHKPDLIFYSDNLKPNHFTDKTNQYIYAAILDLTSKGIKKIDSLNIIEDWKSNEGMKRYIDEVSLDALQELIDKSHIIARSSEEEYKLLAGNVVDAAFRREMIDRLKDCSQLCATSSSSENIQQEIYSKIDDIMVEYSTAEEIPQFKDVVDECWVEIQNRQGDGYAGIPFKFKTLNEYATIERGELFLFAGGAKEGKSMMLLNCAVDLLKRGLSVLYIDSELNTRLFTARLLAHLSGIEFKKLTSGNYSEEEGKKIQKAIAWLKKKNFTHIYLPMFDQQTIYTTVRKVSHTQGLDVLIVDYFKGSSDGDAFNSYQELGRFVDMVKNKICGDMQIYGIGAAQATTSGKVADSAKIGRNASTIALIQSKTPEEIEADGPECGNKKLRVVLNRNGMQHAPGEYISLHFDGNHILYEEAQQQTPQVPF